jgi:hypothetical protein
MVWVVGIVWAGIFCVPPGVQALSTETETFSVAQTESADTHQQDLAFWQTVHDGGNDPALLKAYLDAFPNGVYAAEARNMLDELQSTAPQSPSPSPELLPEPGPEPAPSF